MPASQATRNLRVTVPRLAAGRHPLSVWGAASRPGSQSPCGRRSEATSRAHLGAQRVHQCQSHNHQPRARSSRAAAASPLRPRLLLARPRRADAALGDGQVHASYTFTHGPCESCYCIAHHPARNTQRVTRPGARVARHRRQRARQTRPRRLGRSATSPTRHSLGALPTARSNACDTADVLPDLGGVRRRIAPWLAGAPRRG